MNGATMFSGIGAPETAMPHWHWAWSAEIEKFPAAVHAARHPQSVNLGDVTAHDFCERAAVIGRPDIIVFGSPCQSFSIAGKRLGMDDPRGNLALVVLGIVARLAPRWFTFENVPGLLSSAEGSDFGIFLRTVDELGYSLAWAVLDAQHFGVAQRRERVFAVGHLGDWRGPAAVLFEPESLCGHHPPRRKAGEVAAQAIDASAHRRRGSGMNPNQMVGFNNTGQGWWSDAHVAGGLRDMSAGSGSKEATLVAHAINANGGSGRIDYESETFVTHALRADGFDASEDGTGRGTPLVPIGFQSNAGSHGGDVHDNIAPTLRVQKQGGGGMPAVAFNWQGGGDQTSLGYDPDAQITGVLQADQTPAIAGSSVRRLTPRECERLQGYPDDFTLITYRGKPAADGPRYKALGNSMAVPVMNWILARIEFVDALYVGRGCYMADDGSAE